VSQFIECFIFFFNFVDFVSFEGLNKLVCVSNFFYCGYYVKISAVNHVTLGKTGVVRDTENVPKM
jgi:hypothetical protein